MHRYLHRPAGPATQFARGQCRRSKVWACFTTLGITLAVSIFQGLDHTSHAATQAVRWPSIEGKSLQERTTLSKEPRTTIGTAAGPVATLLNGVVGVTRWQNGSIVIGDAGNSRVLFFDSSGSFSGVIGRAGSGPTEFQYLSWLGSCGPDRLGAYDPARQLCCSWGPPG